MIGLVLAVLLHAGGLDIRDTTDVAMLCEAHAKSRLQAQLDRIEAQLTRLERRAGGGAAN